MTDTTHLEPSSWKGISDDTLCRIIKLSDLSTQLSWSATSHAFFEYAYQRIWLDLRLYVTDFDHRVLSPEVSLVPSEERDPETPTMPKEVVGSSNSFGRSVQRLRINVRKIQSITPKRR